ncbi:MAG TPA: hypothetical protein VNX68_18010 [Nitrosopumilaceae archaeon]|jgi:hypothetical protein|nr:hypothetical protein [Nitrosopumilaceae archaeon]
MTTFNYVPNLNGLRIINTEEEQLSSFFQHGHPEFLIPDFNPEKLDIWISYLDFLEANKGIEIYDQDGGEIISNEIIDETGLTKCVYKASIQISEDSELEDINVDMEGYVVQSNDGSVYFTPTQVVEHSR